MKDKFSIGCRIVMLPIFTISFLFGCVISALRSGYDLGTDLFEDLY